ncbi:hypothetical protein HUN59_07230 [Curtobacterium sp. Csp2]|nr:hypothetical protein HUN59_07230 [Curtobacterium sp. Csp2]
MLGIPTHLAPRVNAWSTVRAFHAAAVGSVVAAAVVLLLYRLADPDVRIVGAVLALVPMALMIGVHVQFGTWRSAVAFLLVGGVSAWWFALVVQREVPAGWVTSYLLSLVIIPLVLVGGAGAVAGRVVLWSVGGFLVGRLATSIAVAQVDGPPRPLLLAWVTLGFVVALVLFTSRNTARSERVQPELLRSAREEHVSAYRAGVEGAEHGGVTRHVDLQALGAVLVDHRLERVDGDGGRPVHGGPGRREPLLAGQHRDVGLHRACELRVHRAVRRRRRRVRGDGRRAPRRGPAGRRDG